MLKSGIQVENITKAIRISQAECDDGTRAQDQGSLSGNKFIHTKILITCNRTSCIKIGVKDFRIGSSMGVVSADEVFLSY